MTVADADLVRGALDGSESAFRELVLRYQRAVFGLIARTVHDPARAEELAQDTFVKAFKALHTYDTARKFRAWLLTIAHHTALDEVRKAGLNTVSLDVDREDGLNVQIPDRKSPTPAATLERVEIAELLRRAIARLRPEYRELVTLKYEQELEYEEIVNITGLPVGTVKSALHRARKELADQLYALGWRP